ncbi:WXG100 family type VII secretion target [Peterkaempfera griseoplana]|uniref:hypothetical protein n=1 Tax=Peterkaempfera griseoplana TaxID=66896 RepID=UPI0006E24E95|nr:hypothetical protein [Peterkaempfera griseoplana]
MPGSADYDVSTIKIDPEPLGAEGKSLVQLAQEMGDAILRINNTAAGLKLGWVSPSADEAQDFANRWTKVMTDMFGEKDGATGALPALAGGVMGTAVGFSHVEHQLWQAFNDFQLGMAGGGVGVGGGDDGLSGSGDDGYPKDHTGPDYPITTDYPNGSNA